MGRTRACFQIAGRLAELRERLKREVRKVRALGPRCFKWRLERLSGPKAGEFLRSLMASAVSRIEKEKALETSGRF